MPESEQCRRECHPAPLGSSGTASASNGAERRANVVGSAQSSLPDRSPLSPGKEVSGEHAMPASFAESPLQHHAQRTGGRGVHALEERWRSSKGGSRQLRLPWEGWPSAGARPVRCESVIPVPSDERNSMERDQGEKASCLRPDQSPPGGESPSAHWPASKQRGNRC